MGKCFIRTTVIDPEQSKSVNLKVNSLSQKQNVLVIGAHLSHGISIIRSMGEKGFNIHTVGDHKSSPGFKSKYIRRYYYFPYRTENWDDEHLLPIFKKIIEEDSISYVFCVEERLITFFNGFRKEFSETVSFLIPPQNKFEYALLKEKTIDLFDQCGLSYPKSVVISDGKELVNCKNLRYPVILKQSFKFPISFKNKIAQQKVTGRTPISDFDELQMINESIVHRGTMIVQEFIDGKEGSVMFVAKNGDLQTAIESEYTAEILKGLSIARKTVSIDSRLVDLCQRVCKTIEWNGIGGLDFIKTKDNSYFFFEFNGRFTASTNLGLQVGIDLPALHFNSVQNKSVQPLICGYPSDYHDATLSGLTWWLLYVLSGRRKYSGGRLAAIGYYFSFFINPKRRFDLLSIKDPIPGIIQIAGILLKPFSLFKIAMRRLI